MSKGVAGKIKINHFEDIIGEVKDGVTEVALSELHEFSNHPFRVQDDEKMVETVESIQKYGVLMPGIVRPRNQGGYEIVSGHRRKRACELAGLSKMPVFIRDYSDDEAVVIMVDSNIQREELLPSEKAYAYAMKYKALKHQGKKEGAATLEDMAEKAGESSKTIQRYIWLSRLNKALLTAVDEGKVSIVSGVDLSFLKEEEQGWVEEIYSMGFSVSSVQAAQLKQYSKSGMLSEARVRQIFSVVKKKPGKFSIKTEKLRKYFDESVTEEEMEETILKALDAYMAQK